jgi:hypothetical protein
VEGSLRDIAWRAKDPTKRKKKKKGENSFIGNMEGSWMIELK